MNTSEYNKLTIELKNISKIYQIGEEMLYALNEVNLQITANEYVAIIGPSGSGKSTLMNLLGCLDNPSQGHCYIQGKDVATLDEAALAMVRNQQIGFIFQSYHLLPRATALQNVMHPLIYRVMPTRERKQQATQALSKVGLENKLDQLPNQLSGGQRQRVAIARALVTHPAILLGDEPTGNLDSKTSIEIMELFDELHRQGHTIILVTHEQEIADHCQRVIRLVDGQIAEDSRDVNTRDISTSRVMYV